MTQHTPPPWEQIGTEIVGPIGPEGIAIARLLDGTTTGAPPLDIRSERWQLQMANARLIVAAPELLEACEALLEVTFQVRGFRHSEVDEWARAIVAKAKRKEPPQ